MDYLDTFRNNRNPAHKSRALKRMYLLKSKSGMNNSEAAKKSNISVTTINRFKNGSTNLKLATISRFGSTIGIETPEHGEILFDQTLSDEEAAEKLFDKINSVLTFGDVVQNLATIESVTGLKWRSAFQDIDDFPNTMLAGARSGNERYINAPFPTKIIQKLRAHEIGTLYVDLITSTDLDEETIKLRAQPIWEEKDPRYKAHITIPKLKEKLKNDFEAVTATFSPEAMVEIGKKADFLHEIDLLCPTSLLHTYELSFAVKAAIIEKFCKDSKVSEEFSANVQKLGALQNKTETTNTVVTTARIIINLPTENIENATQHLKAQKAFGKGRQGAQERYEMAQLAMRHVQAITETSEISATLAELQIRFLNAATNLEDFSDRQELMRHKDYLLEIWNKKSVEELPITALEHLVQYAEKHQWLEPYKS